MVSIIIPVYNGKKYINSAINSCLKQIYKNIEIVIVNDGSTDGLRLESIDSRDKRIKFFSKSNEGPGYTRNFGIQKAQGKYIFFLDVDDTIPENTIKLLVEVIGEKDIAIGRCERVFYNINNVIYKRVIWKKKLYDNVKNKYDLITDTISTNKLYKKEFLEIHKIYFEKGFYEDKLFVLKVIEISQSIAFVDNIVYEWRVEENSYSITNQATIENLKSRMKAIYQCLDYTQDEQVKLIIIKNVINHDFKIYVNKSPSYTKEEINQLYHIYKNFYNEYKKYIDKDDYFVNKIILDNIHDQDRGIKEFITIAQENSTRNIFTKLKKYSRYLFHYLKEKI